MTALSPQKPLPPDFASVQGRIPEPRAVDWHMGALMIWHLTAEDSGGLLALGEVELRPGCEPPIHVHAREDEAWYVIEGEILFQLGQAFIEARAGSAVLLPRGIPHGFAVRSPTARLVHLYTPGGIEQAFRSMSVPAARRALPPRPEGPPDAQTQTRIAQVYGERGVTFVGRPLPVLLAGAPASAN